MRHQVVSVDFWEMLKKMLTYGILAALFWVMLRLFHLTIMLPRQLRSHKVNIQTALKELQRKFPDLNITEEEIENLETDLEKMLKEDEESKENAVEESDDQNTALPEETKKVQ